MSDDQASPHRMRSLRVVLAFLVLLSTVVLIPGAPSAEAAADDLWVTKSVDSNAIYHGALSNWTITVDTSADLTLADSIVVTDTLPDGLCPQGAGDADCPGGVAPVPAYTSAVENADGTWTLIWNLADMGPSSQVVISYTTLTRTHFQEGFADDTPIVARDAWVNTARVEGNVDGIPVIDVNTVSQVATGVTVAKDVASRPASLPQPAVCGDGGGLTWIAGNATGYRVGDQICWRLSVDYPADLYTLDSAVSDAVPSGQAFTADDTWALGAGNTVPAGDIDGSFNLPGAGTLSWDIGDAGGYVGSGLRFEVVYSTTVVDPSATSSGQIVTNVMNHSHNPTTGGAIGAADVAGSEINEAELSITKGVAAVNAISTGGPNVDGVEVSESDVITYQISVTNNGDVDATNVEVWDVLPALFATCSTNVSAIGGGGVCVDGSNRVEWVGAATLSVAAGATTTVTYDVTLPSGIAPTISMGNTAGVRSYATATNTAAGSFTYVPHSNIDPAATGQNTTAARDTSSVVTPSATLTNARTTGVDEAGNHADSQAAIGELVTYTISLVIPEGTTVYDADVFDDLPVNLDLVTSSHTFDGEEAVTRTEDAGADTVTVEFPNPSYRNAPGTGDDTLTLTVVGRVIDIPANTRNTTITNTPIFSWLDQDSIPHSINAGVNVTVVEPLIGIGKTSVDSIGDNGVVVGDEIVDYTVTVTNSGTSNVSTAHDLVIVDTLPEGMTVTLPVPDGGVWAPDATPGDGIGGTITWSVSSLGPGSAINRTYQVTVDDPVVVNSTFVNNVEADTTSMAGTPAVERSAGTGYHAEVGHILSTPLASLSSAVSPTGPTIGDVVTYTAEVRMPPGTIMYDATVIDTLGAGIIFDRLASFSCDMGGAACDPAIGVSEIGVAGSTTAAFFLGDIDVSSSTGEERVVTILYEAHVTDSLSAGDTRANSVSVYGNQSDLIVGVPATPPASGGFDVAVGPASAPVTIKEPSLSIDKDVSGQSGDSDARRAVPGEALTYTITVANSGSSLVSAAYDIVIVDTVPEGITVTLPIADGGVWVADGVPGNGVGGTITWTYAGPLATGASLLRTYEATVHASLDSSDENPAGPELLNTADVPSYFGVSSADRAANPSFTFLEYNDVTADQVAVELDLASVGSVVWFDIDADGVQEAGEPPLVGVDVIVRYLGPDGVVSGDDEVHTVATAADGSYLVEHLPGGTYTVAVDLADVPAGFVPSYDLDDGTLAPDGTWGPGALGQDEDKLNVDFGFTGTGSIGDLVWFDSDADQSMGGSEYGLEGIGVTVTWLGVDGVMSGDDVAYPAVTDATGNYLLQRLPAGLYTVVVDAVSLPAGMQPTYDSNGIATPHATAVVLGSGEDNTSQDFGYAGTGALGDYVWLDRDGDGVQDPGESGLVGVPIQLTWPGEDGVLGGGDDELFLATTAPGGLYFIPNLPPGEYIVEVLGGLPGATNNTFDEDGGGDARTQVNLTDGEAHLTTDFGFHGTASIGDTVWWDQDGNGTQDAGEPGISGVAVELTFAGIDGVFGNADDLLFTATTDDGGGFLFTDLPAGSYEVVVSGGLPAGVIATFDEDGGLDGRSLTTLAVDEVHLGADFGYNGTGEIGDFVWLDLNADGIQDPLEPGVPLVDIQITWYGGDGLLGTADDAVVSTTTDVDGNYSVSALLGGDYDVAVIPASLPSGMAQTYDADGLASPHVSSLLLGGGSTDAGQDFGYNGGGIIGDSVWFDRNGDGAFDLAEYGIAGVDVEVIWAGPDGIHTTADDETFVRTTDALGEYEVTNLPPGQYAVVVLAPSLPAGMVPTYDADGALDNQTLFTLAHLEQHRDADFGYSGTGDIGDLVWLDSDGDGGQDPGEPPIPAQAIVLTAAGADGVLGTADDQTYQTTTDSLGAYSFAGLPPSDYEVEVVGPITGAAANTYDEDGGLDSRASLTLGDGVSHPTADFGYIGSAEIGDLVWLDLDADGVADPGEPGFPGVEITVTWLGNDGVSGGGDDIVTGVVTSDASGSYGIAGLPVGEYDVLVTGGVPAGYVIGTEEDGGRDGRVSVSLAAGAVDHRIDFGYAGTGSVGDTVWWDLDADGARGVRENGLSGIDVTITWDGFDATPGTPDDQSYDVTTDADGVYLVTDLPPGGYSVVVDVTDLPPGLVQSFDPDGLLDAASTTTVAPHGAELGLDFGFRGNASISGAIWYDVNFDGLHAPYEPGVTGVDMSVTYLGPDDTAGGGDDVVFDILTAVDGTYVLSGLPSGFFVVVVDEASLPAGVTVFSDGDGDDPTTTHLTVGASSAVVGVDFLVMGDASLNGILWNDRNGDGVRDAEEVGVSEVGFSVTWEHIAGPVALDVETDAAGRWELVNLPPGVYSAELDLATLPIGMYPTTPTSLPAVLAGGDEDELGFGVALMLNVGSMVWVDADSDGVPDEGEEGVAGVTVNLYDELGGLVAMTETTSEGAYGFADLQPGVYSVQVEFLSVPNHLHPTHDRDGDADLLTSVDLTEGQHILDANFGFQVALPNTGLDLDVLTIWGLIVTLFGAAMVATARASTERQFSASAAAAS